MQLIDGKFPCIGGPWDGKLIQTDGSEVIQAPILPDHLIVGKIYSDKPKFETVIYRMKLFYPSKTTPPIAVYVVEGWTIEDIIIRLLEYYCKNEKFQKRTEEKNDE
jgi:hypothetical protein